MTNRLDEKQTNIPTFQAQQQSHYFYENLIKKIKLDGFFAGKYTPDFK